MQRAIDLEPDALLAHGHERFARTREVLFHMCGYILLNSALERFPDGDVPAGPLHAHASLLPPLAALGARIAHSSRSDARPVNLKESMRRGWFWWGGGT